jgi:hypothetical protein
MRYTNFVKISPLTLLGKDLLYRVVLYATLYGTRDLLFSMGKPRYPIIRYAIDKQESYKVICSDQKSQLSVLNLSQFNKMPRYQK